MLKKISPYDKFLRIFPAELMPLMAGGKSSYTEINGKLPFLCDHLVQFIKQETQTS